MVRYKFIRRKPVLADGGPVITCMSFGIVSYTSNIRYYVVTAPTMLPPEATSLLQEIMVESW